MTSGDMEYRGLVDAGNDSGVLPAVNTTAGIGPNDCANVEGSD